ncbi:MAG: ABC transporter permease, partial [Chloroflexi bacterium]|nr:ABC transporter permease [Chloroflexota bacterium]
MSFLAKVRNNPIFISALIPLGAMVVALLIGAVMLLFLRAHPLQAYAALIGGALGDVSGLTQSAVKATPLLLVGLGIVIAFRASVINIGGEGQIIAGALLGTWFALAFRTWPG